MPKAEKAVPSTATKSTDKAIAHATHAAKAKAWSAKNKPGSDGRNRGRFGR